MQGAIDSFSSEGRLNGVKNIIKAVDTAGLGTHGQIMDNWELQKVDVSRRRLSVWNSPWLLDLSWEFIISPKINNRSWLDPSPPFDRLHVLHASIRCYDSPVWELLLQVRKGLLARPLPFDLNESEVKCQPIFSKPVISDFFVMMCPKHTLFSQFSIDALCYPAYVSLHKLFALSRMPTCENVLHTWASITLQGAAICCLIMGTLFPLFLVYRNNWEILLNVGIFLSTLCCRFHRFS